MPWPKKQVIQFDPGTDYRIFRGAIGLDRHLCSLSSCLVQGQHVFTFTQQKFEKEILRVLCHFVQNQFLWFCGCGLHVVYVDIPKFASYGATPLNKRLNS